MGAGCAAVARKGGLGMRILVAEDDFASRFLLENLLRPYGNCVVTMNGAEAIQAFGLAWDEGDPFDLVCLDIMMPGVDGQEALRWIRAEEERRGIRVGDGVKIVMTAALNDSGNVFGAFNQHCDGYLVKPLSKQGLAETLGGLGLTPLGQTASS